MNKLIGLIIIISALVGAATAWRFPFSLGQNRTAGQINASPEATDETPIGQTQVQPANRTAQETTQAPATTQPTAQAPQTVGQADPGTPQPTSPAAGEPIPALW